MKAGVYRYRTDEGQRPIIAKEGRKLIAFVAMGCPITVTKVPKSEQRYMAPLEISPAKAARTMRRAGKNLGITKGATAFLRGL